MEEPLPLVLVVVLQFLVHVELRRRLVGRPMPVPDVEAGSRDRTLGQGLFHIQVHRSVEHADRSDTLTRRAHALRRIERESEACAHVGLTEAREQQPQIRIRIGRGTDCRPHVGAHALLVDDDCRRQILEVVHLGAREGRHKPLDEGGVGFVDQPTRLRRDRPEYQRGLARPRQPGEHRERLLGDVYVDALEIVDARPADADFVVIVHCGMVGGMVVGHGKYSTGAPCHSVCARERLRLPGYSADSWHKPRRLFVHTLGVHNI